MYKIVGILSRSLPLLSTVAGAVSPQSVGSDLSIITHNDLYGNATTRNAAAVILDKGSVYSAATSRCAALGTTLWNPDRYGQDLDFLQYLDYDRVSNDVGAYWINGNGTLHCRAITTDGKFKSYPCTAQLPALCSNTATDTVRQVTVATNNATITGLRDRQAFRFLGLKYATIPARFAQSTYLPPVANTTALQYGPTCYQGGCKTCSEDCLYLNVWTPYLPNGKVAASKKRAVMLWIHGGGFTSGSGSDPTFDGSALASRGDVVVVTINYRLSVLGFLAVENTTATGNYGLQDANIALDWVLQHIEDFGGDKNRITIFGQSAGAASARALLASPQAREKVAGAIMMSTPQGTGARVALGKYLSLAEATAQAQGLKNATGCSGLGEELVTCLKQVDPVKLVAQKRTVNTPVVDGTFLTASSLDLSPSAPKLDIPVLVGVMHDDGSPFVSPPTSTNLSTVLTAESFPTSDILASTAFPLPPNANITQAIFNLTSRISTDIQFRCLGQSTAYVASKNAVFDKIYAYEFERAYQLATYSPNPPACEAPITPSHPFGDPSLPFYKCHSGELYTVFGTVVRQGRPLRDANDVPFSQYIVDMWSAFARTGDPTPAAAFLEARGFVNTTAYVERGGAWDPVGEGNEEPLRVLDVYVRNEAWREVEQCEVLGQGLDFWEEDGAL